MAQRVFIFVILLSIGFSQTNHDDLKHPRGYPNYTFLKWSVKLGFLDLVDLEPEIPDSIIIIEDIVYKETVQRSLMLDIYKSKRLTESAPKRICNRIIVISVFPGNYFPGSSGRCHLCHTLDKS